MPEFFRRWLAPLLLVVFCLGLGTGGCRQKLETAPSEVPVIPVSKPIQREVTDYVDFTGRTDAVHSVKVQARATGYLVKMPFREGAEVLKGDLLFEIDPSPYQASLDLAKAKLDQAVAQLKYDEAEYERVLALFRKESASINDLQKARAARDIDVANVAAAKANVKQAEINLDFTKVLSPIDGRVSRYYLTLGNLVNQDQTLLTTVVSLDPMYAYFDMDDSTLLRIRKAINEGRVKRFSNIGEIPIRMALVGEDDYRHYGRLNFADNTVSASTGTILVRSEFPNPEPALREGKKLKQAFPFFVPDIVGWLASPLGEGPYLATSAGGFFAAERGLRLLTPGMFVRLRLQIGASYQALLVIDRALASDQGLKYLYVLDKDNRVQYRRVETGALQEDGLRVIDKGLAAEDRVVIGALQQVRPRMIVEPELTAMPTLGPAPVGPAAVGPAEASKGTKGAAEKRP
jgi:multidrug efflux system membrane fusion protein